MCDDGYFREGKRRAERECKQIMMKKPIVESLPAAGSFPHTGDCNDEHKIHKTSTTCRFKDNLTACRREGDKNPILKRLATDAIATGCAASGNALYVKAYRDLMMRQSTLGGANMMQGAHGGAFADYFPPGFCPGLSRPIHVPDANTCCTEPAPPKIYSQDQVNRYRRLRDMDYKIFDSNMMMGPRSAFPEFYPDDWQHDIAKVEQVSKCKGKCGGNRVPGPLILDTKCAMTDFIPQGYCAAWYLKQNARIPPYCLSTKLKGRECNHLITMWK